eukprot:scaffold14629_cov72-Cyclotella_meneghiniana.AAC.4
MHDAVGCRMSDLLLLFTVHPTPNTQHTHPVGGSSSRRSRVLIVLLGWPHLHTRDFIAFMNIQLAIIMAFLYSRSIEIAAFSITSPKQLSVRMSSSLNVNNVPKGTATPPVLVPRAAVSVVVRWSEFSPSKPSMARYLLVQRGKEPNKGMWSLPGGKIELGEKTLDAAKRELTEETSLISSQDKNETESQKCSLRWHEGGPFFSSDSIHHSQSNRVSFHYVISQCFAELKSPTPPNIRASDDAMDARWWSSNEMKKAEDEGIVTAGVASVVERSEKLYSSGLLQCED